MLYDIAPPLLLFGSLGGIILVVSRVISRIRRREFSRAVQVEGSRASRSPQQLLNPNESKVTLMKSRLAAVGSSAAKSLASLREIPTRVRERRQEKASVQVDEETSVLQPTPQSGGAGIRPPESSWRSQVSHSSHGLGQRLSSLQKGLASRLKGFSRRRSEPTSHPTPPEVEAEVQPTPQVSFRRTEVEAGSKPRTETTAQRLQAFVKKQRATTSPIEEAQAALGAGSLDQAEDILVPYIAKNPRNPVAYMALGEVALARRSWDEAIEIFEQVLQIDNQTPSAYAKLGEACLGAGRVTRALEALQRAHDAESENVTILKHLLNIAQHMDNQVLQKSVVQKLIVLAPDDPQVHLAADALEAREEEREASSTSQG